MSGLDELLGLFAFCLISTIVVETVAAVVIFKVRRLSDVAVVVLAQVVTNPVVELVAGIAVPSYVSYEAPDMGWAVYAVLVAMELGAIAVEGFVYSKAGFKKPYAMSFALNAISVTLGFLIPLESLLFS